MQHKKLPDLGYYDGDFARIAEMKIPMTDRICFFGDGVYDATCTRNGVIYCLDAHVDRFYRSAEAIKISIPFSKEWLKELLSDLVSRVDTSDTDGEASLYFQISRSAGTLRTHVFPDLPKPKLWVTVTPKRLPDLSKPIRLSSIEDIRYHMCHVKTVCLLPNVLAAEYAKEQGSDECVQYRILESGETRMTEGAHTNLYCLKDGVCYTAPLDNLILPGISRKNLLSALKALEIPLSETPFSLDFFRNADELLVSSSSNFCLVAETLDGIPVGGRDRETVKRIQDYLTADYQKATAQ